MEYMEEMMQRQYDAAEHYEEEYFKQMKRFEAFCLAAPGIDESLMQNKTKDGYAYSDRIIQALWVAFKEGAGL